MQWHVDCLVSPHLARSIRSFSEERMSQSIRVVLLATALCSLTACADSPTAARTSDIARPSFKADPVVVANLAGSWTQSPRVRVPWSDGVSINGFMDRWIVITLQQSGSTIKGTSNSFAQYFYADGTPLTGVVSAGSNGAKISGTVSSLTDAVLSFGKNGGEVAGPTSYTMTISADGRAMSVVNPFPGGLQGFTR